VSGCVALPLCCAPAGDVEVHPLSAAREAFALSHEPGRRGKVVLAVAG
jgi:hypothetical protein